MSMPPVVLHPWMLITESGSFIACHKGPGVDKAAQRNADDMQMAMRVMKYLPTKTVAGEGYSWQEQGVYEPQRVRVAHA